MKNRTRRPSASATTAANQNEGQDAAAQGMQKQRQQARERMRRAAATAAEQLEQRQLFAAGAQSQALTWVNDNWEIVTDTAPSGLSDGDTVKQRSDDVVPGGGTIGVTLKYLENAFPTIGQAVTATQSGGTVNVVSGTQNQPVTLSRPMIVRGAQVGASGPSRALSTPILSEALLSEPTGATFFNVTSSDVKISGFRFQNSTAGAAVNVATGTTNVDLLDNIFTLNASAVQFGSGTGVIQGNLFTGNNESGTNSGQAVRVTGAATGVDIIGNEFRAHSAVSVVVATSTSAAGGVEVTGNTIAGHTTGTDRVGVRVDTGGATITSNNFAAASLTRNQTDVRIGASAGTVSLDTPAASAQQAFGGDVLVDNQSAQDLPLGNASLDGLTNNFRIEDRVRHGVDTASPTDGTVYWNAGNVYVTTPGGGSTDSSVQQGVDAANPNDTVHLEAGSYVGEVNIGKALALRGPNDLINPNTGTRVAEAVILPSLHEPDPNSPTSTAVVYATVGGVSIKGVTVDGDNTALAGGVDAVEGIASYEGVGNITVENNIVRNTSYAGLDFYNFTSTAATGGNSIRFNKIENIGSAASGYGVGVILYNNFYADVSGNVMANVRTGVQTGNFSKAAPAGATASISNNVVSSWRTGVFHNLAYGAASPFTISGNTFSPISTGDLPRWDGVTVSSIQGVVGATISNNTITVAPGTTQQTVGYQVWNSSTSAGVTLTGGSVSGATYGVWVNNYEGYPPSPIATGSSAVTVSDVSISDSGQAGVYVKDNPANPNNVTVSATLTGGTTITGGAVGVLIEGTDASVPSLGNASITGQSAEYVRAVGTAPSLAVDATGATLGGVAAGSTLTLADALALEDKITHGTDATGTGLVRTKASNVYVTQDSGSVQRGVNVASAADTINVGAGTFTEATVNISKTGLTLSGAKAGVDARSRDTATGESIVNPGGAGGTTGNFVVAADGVTIDGFEFTNTTKAIHVFTPAGAANVKVLNNYVHGSSIDGVNLFQAETAEVARNLIVDVDTGGITAGDSASATHIPTTANIHDNTVINASYGITGYHANSQITGNTVKVDGAFPGATTPRSSTGGTVADGLGISGQHVGGTISTNTVSGYAGTGGYFGGGAGIYMGPFAGRPDSSNVAITGNTLSGNRNGVAVDTGTNITIGGAGGSKNVVTGGAVGINIGANPGATAGEVTVRANDVTGATAAGVRVANGRSATVSGVDLSSAAPGAAGVVADGAGTNVVVQQSDLTGNTAGIRVSGGAVVDAGDTTGTGAGITGIALSTGGNTLTGYTGTAGNYAIENLNLKAESIVKAEGNNFGPNSTNSVIESVIFDDSDNPAKSQVDFTPAAGTDAGLQGTVYVDDDYAGRQIGESVEGHTFGVNAFAKLSDALNAVVADGSGIIHLAAGTYTERLSIDKPVQIRGAYSGVAGSDAARTAAGVSTESRIVAPGSLTASDAAIEINSAGVKIDGITFDGNGTARGIRVNGVSNVQITNSIVEDVKNRAIQFNGAENVGNTGGLVSGNLIRSVTTTGTDPLGPGYGVVSFDSSYVSVVGNVMTGVDVGVYEQYVYLPNGGSPTNTISGNQIQANVLGYGTNERGVSAATTELNNNTITVGTGGTGVEFYNVYKTAGVTLTGNTISGGTVGAYVHADGGSVTFTGGSIAGSQYGVHATNYLADFSQAATLGGTVNLNGVAVSAAGGGTAVYVEDNAGSTAAVAVALNGATSITAAGGTAVRISGPDAQLVGDTLGTSQLAVAGGDFVVLENNARSVNGTSASFNTVNGASATPAELFAIENKITHAPDNASLGLVRVKAGNVYVTDPSFASSSAESIANAIAVASDNDTINLENGTYALSATLAVNKPVSIVGQTAGSVTLLPAVSLPGGLMNVGGGTLNDAGDHVTIRNVDFVGTNAGASAELAVNVGTTADFGTLTIADGSISDFALQGLSINGDPTDGLSLRNLVLTNLEFSQNGRNQDGSGDVSIFNYNGDATLTDLDFDGQLVGPVGSEVARSRFALQFRGRGYATGGGPMGAVTLNGIDVEGAYRNSFIGIQGYSDVQKLSPAGPGLSLNDIALGGNGSRLTGTFGAALRFDKVGVGTVSAPASVDLGNTLFRGLGGGNAYSQVFDLEFAPDNNVDFLRADATNTVWTIGASDVAASSLTTGQALGVEDRILHFVDMLHPTHAAFGGYRGFAVVKANNVYVTDQATNNLAGEGSINRAVQVANAGDTVNLGAGTFTQNVVLDKRVTLDGVGSGAAAASNTLVTPLDVNQPAIKITASGIDASSRLTVQDLRAVGSTLGGTVSNIVAADASHLALVNVASVGATNDGITLEYGASVSDVVVTNPYLAGSVNAGLQLKKTGAGTPAFDGLTVTGGTVEDNRGNGIITGYLDSFGVTNVTIDGTTFVGNGYPTDQNFGNVMFNKFDGNAAVKNVNINGDGPGGRHSTYGVNLNGGATNNAVNVTVENVNVTGTFRKVGFLVQEFGKVGGFSLAGLDVRGAASGTPGWWPLAIGHSDTTASFNLNDTKTKLLDVWGTGNVNALATQFYDASGNLLNKASLADNFTIEDGVRHALDIPGAGLVTWNAGNELYVTRPGTGPSNETIQNAVNVAVSGVTVIQVQAGTHAGGVTTDKDVTILGAQAAVDPVARNVGSAGETVITAPAGQNGFTVTGAGRLTLRGVDLNGIAVGNHGVESISADARITLENSFVHNFANLGVATAAGSHDNRIAYNDISGNFVGVYLGSGTSNDVVEGNYIHHNSKNTTDAEGGITLEGSATNTTIRNNTIADNAGAGLYVFNLATADFTGTVVKNNSFTGNTDGLRNANPTTLNASPNYWGSPSGPANPGNTSGGTQGQAVFGAVTFAPFLTNGTDADASLSGFQTNETPDVTPPAPPSTPDLATDSGASGTDNITSVTSPTFTGTAEAGSFVRIYSDGVEVGSGAAAAATGSYSITLTTALVDGQHSITAVATDIYGNASTPSAALSVRIDTSAATIATFAIDPASDSPEPNVPSGRTVTRDTTPTFNGTAESGTTVTLYRLEGTTEVVLGTATAAGAAGHPGTPGGAYTVTSSTLAPGVYTLSVRTTDAAGNTSTPPLSLDVEILAPVTNSEGEHYSTIGDAIAGTSDNGEIYVPAGTFKESLLIDRPLKLSGVAGHLSRIDVSGLTGVTITASNVTLDGFDIVGNASNHFGVRVNAGVNHAAGVRITNNQISGIGGNVGTTPSIGILADATPGAGSIADIRVTGNQISNIGTGSAHGGYGIALEEVTGGAVVSGNTLAGVAAGSITGSAGGVGIVVADVGTGFTSPAVNVDVTGNTYTNIPVGVLMYGDNDSSVTESNAAFTAVPTFVLNIETGSVQAAVSGLTKYATTDIVTPMPGTDLDTRTTAYTSTVANALAATDNGGNIGITAGAWAESVSVAKSVKLTGIGGTATLSGITLTADIHNASSDVQAPVVNVNAGGSIQDGVLLAQPGGTVNIGVTTAENVTVAKDVTLTRVAPAAGPVAASITLASGADVSGSTADLSNAIIVQAGAVIDQGVLLVTPGGIVNVGAGTFLQTVTLGKSLTLTGAGSALTTVSGTVRASAAEQDATIRIAAPNVTVEGLTITREGNTVAGWSELQRKVGVAVQGFAAAGAVIRNNVIVGNRTGIDLNQVDDVTVYRNEVSNNRTGMILRNEVTNSDITENFIRDNWTAGLLYLQAAPTPLSDATGTKVTRNFIAGNWYAQIENRATNGGEKLFYGNWLGTNTPATGLSTTLAGSEPGYMDQIPAAFGGSATPPATSNTVKGNLGDVSFAPWLSAGTEAAADVTTPGFQPNAPLTIDVSGGNAAEEGSAYTLTLSPTNPGSLAVQQWSINWGDGTPVQELTVDPNGGPLTVDHVFTDNGSFPVVATATTIDNVQVTTNAVTVAVSNVAPVLTNLAATPISENGVTVLSGKISDASTVDTFTLSVDWGDTVSELNINLADPLPANVTWNAGTGEFTISHKYLDDNAADTYTAAVTVTDDDNNSDTESTSVIVTNVKPTGLSLTPAGPLTVNEGGSVTIGGSFLDPGTLDTHSVVIDWGDGTTSQTLPTLAANVLSFSNVTHTYADNGSYVITVRVNDDDDTAAADGAVATKAVTVLSVDPTLAMNGASSVDEGSPYTLTLTSADPGADAVTSYTINWGVGAPQTVAVVLGTNTTYDAGTQTYTTTVTHVYPGTSNASDSYTISATATDTDGGPYAVANTVGVTVNDVEPVVTLTGSRHLTTPGSPAASAAENAVFTLTVGPAVDPGSAGGDAPQSYRIHWGDGQFTDITEAALNAAGRKVTHVYDDGAVALNAASPAASHTVSVDLIDNSGVQYHADAGTLGVVVYNLAPTAVFGGSGTVAEGSSATVSFLNPTDAAAPDRAAGYTYSYDFDGDGTFEVSNASSASVSVPSSYTSDGPKALTVVARIFDKDGGFTQYQRTINVTNVAPVVNAGPDAAVGTGQPFTATGVFTDPGFGPTETWTATVNYGDGTGVQPLTLSSNKTFTLNHVYTTPSPVGNPYVVTVVVTDDDGGTHTDTLAVNVTQTAFGVAGTPVFTPSGVDVTFTKPVNAALLNVWANGQASDVTLVGQTTGAVRGSLVWDASSNTARFMKTGGALVPDTYTLTLAGGANGFVSTTGDQLPGATYTFSQTVAATTARTLSLPDFARGPGQSVDINYNAAQNRNEALNDNGLPIRLDNPSGVRAIDFDLVFDSNLLTIGSNAVSTALPGAWSVTQNVENLGGSLRKLRVTISTDGAPLSGSAPVDVARVEASVPASAPYGAAQALRFTQVRLNEGLIAARGDGGTNKITYMGDATGDGTLGGLDASVISRMVVGSISGLVSAANQPVAVTTDPLLIADVTGNGDFSGLDASMVAQKSVNEAAVGEIPNLPGILISSVEAGYDPTITVGNASIFTGSSGLIGVAVTATEPGAAFYSVDLNLAYDTTWLNLTSIARSQMLIDLGWGIGTNLNGDSGLARVTVYSTDANPISAEALPQLLRLTFAVEPAAPAATIPVSLAAGSRIDEGRLVLTPVAGSVRIPVNTAVTVNTATPLEGSAVSLTGSTTNATGAVSYAWTILKNGSPFTTGTGANFAFTPDDNGSYAVSLATTDANGNTGAASTTVTVGNVAPDVVTINPPAGPFVEGSPITLGSTVHDPGAADTLTYAWTVTSNNGQATVTGSGSSITFTPNNEGVYTVNFTATDDDGASTAATAVALTVGNATPTVSITSVTPAGGADGDETTEGVNVTVTGTYADAGPLDVHTVSVDWGDGVVTPATVNTATRTFTATRAYADDDGDDTYTISVTATDNAAAPATSAAATRNITVRNVAPTATLSLSASTVNEGGSVTASLINLVDVPADLAGLKFGFALSEAGLAGDYASAGTTPSNVFVFPDDGSYTVWARVFDNDGGFTTYSSAVTVNPVAPTLTISGAATVAEGATYSLSLASSDPGADTITQWTINWGDGIQVVAGNPASVTHVYADGPAGYTISATATDEDGTHAAANTVSVTVTNVAPTLTISGAATTAEGATYTLSLSSSDIGPDTISQWTINWGDNSGANSDGIQIVSGNPGSVTHVFADGLATRTITATATDEDGTYSAGNTVSVTVTNVAPTLTISGAATVLEGASYELTLASTDVGADAVQSWSVNWGDGPAVVYTAAEVTAGGGKVTHVYADGPASFTITATATDEDGTYAANSQPVSVTNKVPTAALSLSATSINEGGSITADLVNLVDVPADLAGLKFSFALSESGLAADYASAGTASSHVFPFPDHGSFTIWARVYDDDGGVSTYSQAVTVSNVPPTFTVAGDNSVDEGAPYTLTIGVANDPGADTITSYQIDWGDGSPLQVISAASLPASRAVTHTFADGVTTPTITVGASDEDGTYPSIAVKTVTVNNVAPTLTLTGDNAVDEGSPYTLTLGAVTDPGADAIASYTINWGDGSPAQTILAADLPAGRQVLHTFADGLATRTITVDVADDDGAHLAVATKVVTVNNVAPSFTVAGNNAVDEGAPYTLTIGAVTEPGADAITSYQIDWGDGSAVQVITAAALPGSRQVTHTFADGVSNPTIVVGATDEDGTYPSIATKTVTVNNVAPTFTVSGAGTVNEGAAYTLTIGPVADAGADAVNTYTIDWGDGTAVQSVLASALGATREVTHVYADGAAGAGTLRTITVGATDDDGSYPAVATQAVSVLNVAPTLTLGGASSVEEGATYSLTLSATDPGQDTITSWTVDWGDGTPVSVLNAAGGAVTHVFADGPATRSVTATATDEDGTYAAPAKSVTVTNANPVVTIAPVAAAPETTPVTLDATVTDAGTLPAEVASYAWVVKRDGVVVTPRDAAGNPVALNTQDLTFVPGEPGAYEATLTATDKDGGVGSAVVTFASTAVTLRVAENGFVPTASGFEVRFTRSVKIADVNLYDTAENGVNAADLVVLRNGTEPVYGSLAWDDAGKTATFVRTGGALEAGTYTVTLKSGAGNGWADNDGHALDGDHNYVDGSDYVAAAFTVAAPAAGERVLGIGEHARGPGQTLSALTPWSASNPTQTLVNGLPLTLSNAAGVGTISFTLRYDPSVLENVSLVRPDGTTAVGTVDAVNGTITVTNAAVAATATGEVFRLLGSVKSTAAYGTAEALRISGLTVKDASNVTLASRADSGFHAVSFVGDASGEGTYGAMDGSDIARNVVGLDDGFEAHPRVDPLVAGDVTGDGTLSGLDASWVVNKGVGNAQPEVPALPVAPMLLTASGAAGGSNLAGDPVNLTVDNATGAPGSTVTVGVDVSEVNDLRAADITLTYDTDVLSLTGANGGVGLGDLTSGWTIVKNVDPATGKVRASIYNAQGLVTAGGELMSLNFQVAPTATPGDVATINLVTSGRQKTRLNEDRITMAGSNGAVTVGFTPTVAGRHLFYNNSKFDAGGADDAAISGKTALLPGQTAGFANVSSYSKGINGIMVDVAGLPAGTTEAQLAAALGFKVGNVNDTGTWGAAPAPLSLTVRRGVGDSGSDRVTIVWADGAITGKWLQVTVPSGTVTGLAAADVFYFGNAVGETGDQGDSNFIVNATDEINARNNPREFTNPADINFAYDFDRDGLVNATDEIIARNNGTDFLTALARLAPGNGVQPSFSQTAISDDSETDGELADLLA